MQSIADNFMQISVLHVSKSKWVAERFIKMLIKLCEHNKQVIDQWVFLKRPIIR